MARQEGSLYNIRDTFRFRGLAQDPSQSVHKWMEFLEFSTEGLILTNYLKLTGTSSLQKMPKSFPADGDADAKVQFMWDTCMKILETIFPDTRQYQTRQISECARRQFCTCKQDKGTIQNNFST